MEQPLDIAIGERDILEVLGKGLRAIEAFSAERPRLSPSELAEAIGISRTAARRYLLSLCHFGYAHTDGKQFWLAPRVLRLGQSYLDGARLPRLVQPFLQRLSMATGETSNFCVLDGHEAVYLAHCNGPRLVSIGFHVGTRVPAHVVAPGCVVAASWPAERLQSWLAQHEFSRFTPFTVSEAATFERQVEATRQLGYCFMQQQLDISLSGMAVALQDRRGKCLGAIGITLQKRATQEEVVAKMLPALMDAQQTLRAVL